MNTAVINIKTNPEVKAQAKEVADELGFSLSSLINAFLKQLVKTKTVVFSASSEEPTEYFLSFLKKSQEDIKAKKISPVFKSANEAIDWLDK